MSIEYIYFEMLHIQKSKYNLFVKHFYNNNG